LDWFWSRLRNFLNNRENLRLEAKDELLHEYVVRDAKIALMCRTVLGLGELTDKRIGMYSSLKRLKKISQYSYADLQGHKKGKTKSLTSIV
jgi:biotin synthase-like enzyme